MGPSAAFYLAFSVISLSFSALMFIYLYVRKQGAEKIVLKIIEVRVNYFSRYKTTYPVCLVIEDGEEMEVEFKKVRMKRFSVDSKVGLEAYRIYKNGRYYYYSVLNYYQWAYVLLVFPIILGIAAVINY